MATAALLALIQQQTSPQKGDPSLLPALQAILAESSPDRKGRTKDEGTMKTNNGQENVPKITVTETPQKMSSSPPGSQQPKRTGSVALFYRKVWCPLGSFISCTVCCFISLKVYQMAFLRIKDMCERLALDIEILRQ